MNQQHGGDAPMRWPLERILFALAGTMTLLAAFLAATVSPWFLLLAAFVGLNQWLYVVAGACPASPASPDAKQPGAAADVRTLADRVVPRTPLVGVGRLPVSHRLVRGAGS
jgi:hypothetical protein